MKDAFYMKGNLLLVRCGTAVLTAFELVHFAVGAILYPGSLFELNFTQITAFLPPVTRRFPS